MLMLTAHFELIRLDVERGYRQMKSIQNRMSDTALIGQSRPDLSG